MYWKKNFCNHNFVHLTINFFSAVNSGFDAQDIMVKLTETARTGALVGLDLESGEPLIPTDRGIYDNYVVKKQMINSR